MKGLTSMPQCGIFQLSMPRSGTVLHNGTTAPPRLDEENLMIRLIKRYESRKLYDTEESRYVSLEEIATWVRDGQEVKVVDNATAADVTSQTLTQIILDEGRRGTSFLPSDLLHELVRVGERAVTSGVEHVQQGVGRLVQASMDRLGPLRRAREEMARLKTQLEQLESSLAELATDGGTPGEATEAKKSAGKKGDKK
jgi:polyhydroxyalkanoate synthesis repressor PhaR